MNPQQKGKPGDEMDPVLLAAQVLNAKKGEALSPVQEKLAELLYRRLAREDGKTEEAEELSRRAREQGALAQAQREANKAAAQAACPHMKPWGGTAVAGQRDHTGTTIFICQYCLKDWRGTDVTKGGCPSALWPPAERIGGPSTGI